MKKLLLISAILCTVLGTRAQGNFELGFSSKLYFEPLNQEISFNPLVSVKAAGYFLNQGISVGPFLEMGFNQVGENWDEEISCTIFSGGFRMKKILSQEGSFQPTILAEVGLSFLSPSDEDALKSVLVRLGPGFDLEFSNGNTAWFFELFLEYTNYGEEASLSNELPSSGISLSTGFRF